MARIPDEILPQEIQLFERGTSAIQPHEIPALLRELGQMMASNRDRRYINQVAADILRADIRPGFFGRLFSEGGDYGTLAKTKLANDVLEAGRGYLKNRDGLVQDALHHLLTMLQQAYEIQRFTVMMPIQLETERQQALQRLRNLTGGTGPSHAMDAASTALGGETNTLWDANDDASRRARVATIQGIAHIDSSSISDPAVAFAALIYAQKLADGADDATARKAAFQDVRVLIAANALSPEFTPQYVAALREARARSNRRRDGMAGLNVMAAAITGRKS